jgi:diguanylate cyclase (GGDEF)-like protein
MFRKIYERAAIKSLGNQQLSSRKVALPWVLTVPFILQVVAVVGLVGYLSYRNGQRAVEDVTNQLMNDVGKRIQEKLTSHLEAPRLVNRLNSDAVLRGDLELNLDQPNPKRDLYLWQYMQRFRQLAWISLGTEQGDSAGTWRPGKDEDVQISISNRSTQYFGTYYAMDKQGRRTTQLKVERPIFDPRTRPWYKEAVAARTLVWTKIYAGFSPGTIFIASSQPLYDRSGKLLGASGIDVALSEIQTFLAQNPVSPTGQTFLIERSGLLVASSSQESPFRIVGTQPPQRVSAFESQTPLIRSTAQFLRQQVKDFNQIQQHQTFDFQLNRQSQFVQVLPFSLGQGLDWLIVIVVPESDVMAPVHANTRTTIGLCLAALLGVILLNTWISQRLIKHIQELSQASQHIAQGDFVHLVRDSNIHELSSLANSFNQMSQEIQSSRQQLEDYSRSLEQKVSDRTQALQQEVQYRAAAEAALQEANTELTRLAYLDDLTQIANRRRFDEQLNQEWRTLERAQLPLSLILCDVDFFKQYNDTYGHQAGDECLRQVAQAVAAAVRRPADLATRYGGEEFALLLPNTPLAGAIEVASSLQSLISDLKLPHQKSQVSEYVTLSLGVATLVPTRAESPQQLAVDADRALYHAKASGRDRIATL